MDETLNPQTDVARTSQSGISRMTDDEKRIRIAELCVFKDIFTTNDGVVRGYQPHHSVGKRLPDYLNDLNAMHEAEKVLTVRQWNKYTVNLARVIAEAKSGDRVEVPTNVLLSATARQRADAFLLTLGP